MPANRQENLMLSDIPASWQTPSSAQTHNYQKLHNNRVLIGTPLS